MVSTERIMEYTKLKPEAEEEIEDTKPPPAWPKQGKLDVKDLSVVYHGSSKQVLKGISFSIPAGSKVGVCGRTGAGKSTFLQALFRLIEPGGEIKIDDIDTKTLGLNDLRSRLAIIPQEPFCWKGSLRSNVDPFHQYSDQELWQAFESVEMKQMVQGLPLQLDAPVADGGSNFSFGERQLICLARALLKDVKIIVADEPTSSIDFATDALIQKAIRGGLEGSGGKTVITIAHRLLTIIDFDLILVLDDGRLVEFDTPANLLSKEADDPTALFRGMVDETGADARITLRKLAGVSSE
ncbi:MAG: hypothetical protein SGCHY_001648 [Lobulomycetales sp.]